MKLFSSISTRLKDFTPVTEGEVSIYSCGPTVYNDPHIGNLSAFIYADVIRRSFAANGYTTRHVMNITDVEDKIIRDSKGLDDDPKKALTQFTQKYTDVFLRDLRLTGNDTDAIQIISAVESIPDMVDMIQLLLDKNIAYIADDGVYFSLGSYQALGNTYGLLQSVEVTKAQARITNDEYSKDVAGDFALWKKQRDGEPSWPADFTDKGAQISMPGRPGWHIECSAMSEKALGVPFDIHTGGIDLKFPHHENEIAQTRGAHDAKLTNHFMHTNHILVDGRKMSKSAGNFFTLRDVEDKHFSPVAFRLLVLESHYRKENNFSWDILTAAHNRLLHWQAAADRRWQLPAYDDTSVIKKMADALANDINTPKVLVLIDGYFNEVEQRGEAPHKDVLQAIRDYLGIDLHVSDITDDERALLEQRQQARADKDWATSDQLRDDLLARGISVKDAPTGQIWSRTHNS